MSTEFDVAVLGGGMAGSAAALAAAEQGARTCIITGPPGATGMFSGGWQGPLVEGARRALASVGYELLPAASELPHPGAGRVRADAAAATHADARLDRETMVVGIAGLPAFDAPALAKRWRAGHSATISIDQTPAAGWGPASLATWLDRNPDALRTPLARVIEQHRPRHIILPAILGMQHDGALHKRLQSDLGCAISEALGVPPSIPGWRLQIALQLALRGHGITVFEDKAHVSRASRGAITEVELQNGDAIRAHSFVLATGKYAAGGIEANGAFRETVFGCPVWIDHLGETFETSEPLILTDPVRIGPQPLLLVGVHADSEHRPLTRTGDVVYRNVLVAGSIRAGWDTSQRGIGFAAQDGWNAGIKAGSRNQRV